MRIQYQDPTNNGSSNAWRILGDTGWGDKVSNSHQHLHLQTQYQMDKTQFTIKYFL